MFAVYRVGNMLRHPLLNLRIKLQYRLTHISADSQRTELIGLLNRAGHAPTLPRQCDHGLVSQKIVVYMAIFVVATPFRHRGLNIFRIFLSRKF